MPHRGLWSTLTFRAIIILGGVLLTSHAASLLVYEYHRDRAIVLTEASDLADRIIGIVQLANALPAEDRAQILSAAETQFLATFPEGQPLVEQACRKNTYANHMSARLSSAFSDLPGYRSDTCIRGLASDSSGAVSGFDVLVSVTFPDGQRSVFHALLPGASSLLSDAFFPQYLLILALALLICSLMILRLVAPLGRLARAAEMIGIDIDSRVLPIEGPREVRAAAGALNDMHVRLQRQIHSQRDILGAVSHDMRSSLTRLRLRVDMLDDGPRREGLLRVTSDMEQMVSSVLDFVRGIGTNEKPRRINIGALVGSLCDDMQDEGYRVIHRELKEALIVFGRPAALKRCVQNLIMNAIQYGEQADVSVVQEGCDVRVHILDSGPGLPEQELSRVLQPFYRVERSRSMDTGGIGLGLSIAQSVVQSHGGTLALANTCGTGLLATISLPLFDGSLR